MTAKSDEALFNEIAQGLVDRTAWTRDEITLTTVACEGMDGDEFDDFDQWVVEHYGIDLSDRTGREYWYEPARLSDFLPSGPRRYLELTVQDYVTLAKAGSWAASGLGNRVTGGYRVWPEGIGNRLYIRRRERERRPALAERRAALPAFSDEERRGAIADAAARFSGRPRETITPQTRLYHELDLTGWDYCNFLDWFRDAYGVDLTGLDISRLTVFGGFFQGLQEMRPWRCLALTVEDYVTLSKAPSWKASGVAKTAPRSFYGWVARWAHRR